MFKLQPDPTFFATVEIPLPGDAGTSPLEIELRHMTRAAAAEYFSAVQNDTPGIEVLRALVAGWRGADVEFCDEALVQLDQNYPGAALALLEAYPKALRGGSRKN